MTDTVELPPDISSQLGELRGRVAAIESRMDRHETWMGTTLMRMENKLDDVRARQDRSDGRDAADRHVSDWVKTLMGGSIGAALMWLLGHFGLNGRP